jgi:hypothetical protein
MSFREVIAWVSFASTLVVWSPYFAYTFTRSGTAGSHASGILAGFILGTIVQSLILIVARIALSASRKEEPKDERDVAVESKSLKIAYYVLVSLGFILVGSISIWFMARSTGSADDGRAILWISQTILLCFIVAEATRFGSQAICYRRGA